MYIKVKNFTRCYLLHVKKANWTINGADHDQRPHSDLRLQDKFESELEIYSPVNAVKVM